MFERLPNPQEVEEIMGIDTYAKTTGCEVLRAEAGYAEVRLPVGPNALNGHGNLHGGALFTLADYAAALASNLSSHPTMAVNGSICYLNAVRGGHVLAKARTVKDGRRMKFQVVEIFDAEDRLVATFQGGSMHVPEKKAESAS